jgi:hypothetical protein
VDVPIERVVGPLVFLRRVAVLGVVIVPLVAGGAGTPLRGGAGASRAVPTGARLVGGRRGAHAGGGADLHPQPQPLGGMATRPP